jgi:hypothetical protein
MVVAAAHESG